MIPLSLKYRPTKLEDLILAKGARTYFDGMESIDNNMLFIGTAGNGKTSLAKILAEKFAPNSFMFLNASDESGIDVIRTKIKEFVRTASITGDIKVVVLDEADGLSRQAQEALRNTMEEFLGSVRFILTANYKGKIIDPLQSRCTLFHFSVSRDDVEKRIRYIAEQEGHKLSDDQIELVVSHGFPDIRRCINGLQRFIVSGGKSLTKKVPKVAITVKKLLDAKKDVFAIRQFVANNLEMFSGDYLTLMTDMFELYCNDRDIKAAQILDDRIYQDQNRVDKEINFTGMLFAMSRR